MKKLLILLIIVIAVILFPKPYDRYGGIVGYTPDPNKKCLGYNFSTGPDYADAIYTIWCIGIPYKN